jgi:putative Ca2+/H+ antiporter (TMEM165/GDT1 family)
MLPILFAAYGTVFVAEIVGDKLLYTTGVLATRYRTAPILCGMAIAFMAKMGVAVLVGKTISKLPPFVVAAITTVNFFAIAYALWRKPDPGESKKDYPASKAMMVSFAAIFFSEWGDIGQVTAATLAARFPSPLVVWVGAVGAMVTKGALAAFAGAGVRQWIQRHVSPNTVRYVAVGLLLLLGLLSVAETLSNPRVAPDPAGTAARIVRHSSPFRRYVHPAGVAFRRLSRLPAACPPIRTV